MSEYRMARSTGGHKQHILDMDDKERRALCGYKPGDKTTTRMGRSRVGWNINKLTDPQGTPANELCTFPCEKCWERMEKDGEGCRSSQ